MKTTIKYACITFMVLAALSVLTWLEYSNVKTSIERRKLTMVTIFQTTVVLHVNGVDVTKVLYTERVMIAVSLKNGGTMLESSSNDDPRITCSAGTFRNLTTIPMEVPKERAKQLRAENSVFAIQ